MTIAERNQDITSISTPDYICSWKEKWSRGEFPLYILNEEPLAIHDASSNNIEPTPTRVEGVVFDLFGKSTFIGYRTEDTFSFTKIYSEGARKREGIPGIIYEGKFDPNTKEFRGKISYPPHTSASGTFTLRSIAK